MADRLKLLSRAQRWEEMPQHINDDVLHNFVTIATYDTIGRKLCDRYGGVVTNCEFSIAVKNDADRDVCASLPATFSPKVSSAPGAQFSELQPDSGSHSPLNRRKLYETRTPRRMVQHR